MLVAITAAGADLDAPVDPRFGRAAYFVFVDSKTLEFEAFDNSKNANALQGAGIQAASVVLRRKADVLLTGYCGPNAFKSLAAGKIQVAGDATGTVREALQAFLDGDLTVSEGPNKDAHW